MHLVVRLIFEGGIWPNDLTAKELARRAGVDDGFSARWWRPDGRGAVPNIENVDAVLNVLGWRLTAVPIDQSTDPQFFPPRKPKESLDAVPFQRHARARAIPYSRGAIVRPHLGMDAAEYRAFLAAAFDGPIPQEALETLAEMEASERAAARNRATDEAHRQ